MISRMRVTRRRMLAALGATAAAVLVRSRSWRVLVSFAPPRDAERLAGLVTRRESAEVVGRAYLDAVPHEASAWRLASLILTDLPGGRRAIRLADDEELRGLLIARVHDDFEAARVVDVHGWILSSTEARLYALAALL